MLWEETIPLMQTGYHKDLLEKAFGAAANGRKVYPPRNLVFNAMRLVAFEQVSCVILGQDPYINEWRGVPEAHGLSFSVREGLPAPPSLKNIFQEIGDTVYNGHPPQFSTDLTRWAKQGVLLLNASLTVIAKRSNSHADLGWHRLTDEIIATLSEKREHIVFMLWGAFAQKKAPLIDKRKHCILRTSHPSPLSAHRGFLGSGVFVKCNEYLVRNGRTPITW